MNTESRDAMHRRFLREIREKRAALEEELKVLDAVEKYHTQVLGEAEQPTAPPGRGGRTVFEGVGPLSKRLRGAKKYEAAAIVLEHLGQPTKVGPIIDLLWKNGYETKMKRRILHNSLYTGMDRRKDIFVKGENASWSLVAWPD